MKTKIILDCDPGLDDAVALLAALQAPQFDVLAITTVAGNVPGPQTAQNARIIREVAGRGSDVPVCAGAPRPLVRDAVTAEDFHGSDGLGHIPFARPRFALSRSLAAVRIIRLCRAARAAPLTLVVTGPMTNVALALIMAPDIADGIAEIVVMGGADSEGGNIRPYAEFNIYADPHAASVVFSSGVAVRALSLDVTHGIRTTKQRLANVRAVGTPRAIAAGDLLDASCKLEFSANGHRDAPLHDPSTVIALARPDLFSGRRAHVEVVTDPEGEFGRTIVHFADDGPVMWYEQADADGVFAALCRLLGGR